MDTPTQQAEEIAIAMNDRPLHITVDGCRRRIPIDRVVTWGERRDDLDPDCPMEVFLVYYDGEEAVDIVVDEELEVIDQRYADATS